MELTKKSFQRKALDIIPENERILFVQLSLFANEITMLHKLIAFSNNLKGDEAVLTAQNVQSFFLIKLLAGKLYEGWQILQKNYFNQKLSKQYDDQVSLEGKKSIKYIKSYFKKPNAISLIRNKYAFHYDFLHIKEELNSIPEDEFLDLYLASDYGNSLYSMAHVISSYALFHEIDSTDDLKAIDKIFKDVLGVAKNFLMFSGVVLGEIWKTYKIDGSFETVILHSVPDINSVTLPYFVVKY